MSIWYADDLSALKGFVNRQHKLEVSKREVPNGAAMFFQNLMKMSFGVAGQLNRKTAVDDLHYLLEEEIPAEAKDNPFYEVWLQDMAKISRLFCDVANHNGIRVWIGSKRGCARYHVDNVPYRLLVTYAGKGTEWLPEEASDRGAYARGEPNENIIKDHLAKQFIEQWDVAIFRGGASGLLHRTPDPALQANSILMRLERDVHS